MDLGIPGITDAEVIGSGGSATVYQATQERLGRRVAVKILHVHFGVGTEVERRRFEREQLALGRVSDLPGIVPLYESGFNEGDRPFLIMPLYAAGSLQDRIDASGPPSLEDAAAYMITVGRAVQRAHDDDVLHRDIKPANIMIGRDGRPVIGDFGIARLLGSTTLFQSRALSTTPAFASPEVFAGDDPTAAVDIYGLGATLFALLNGSPAFVSLTGDMNVLALMRRVEADPVPDLRERGVPENIASVIERAMAKTPTDRHASAAEWSDDLEAAMTGSAQPAPMPPPVVAPPPSGAEPTEPDEDVALAPPPVPPEGESAPEERDAPSDGPSVGEPAGDGETDDHAGDDVRVVDEEKVAEVRPTPIAPADEPASIRAPDNSRRNWLIAAAVALALAVGGIVLAANLQKPDDDPHGGPPVNVVDYAFAG